MTYMVHLLSKVNVLTSLIWASTTLICCQKSGSRGEQVEDHWLTYRTAFVILFFCRNLPRRNCLYVERRARLRQGLKDTTNTAKPKTLSKNCATSALHTLHKEAVVAAVAPSRELDDVVSSVVFFTFVRRTRAVFSDNRRLAASFW